MPKLRTLRVFPNPYAYIDHEGRPAGMFGMDPIHHNPDGRHVGVSGFMSEVVRAKSSDYDDRHEIIDVVPVYMADAQLLPDPPSAHYRMGVREGSLIPADEETAKKCGVKWEAPLERLQLARRAAIAAWTANHGEPPTFAVDPDAEQHVPHELGRPLGKGIDPKMTAPVSAQKAGA